MLGNFLSIIAALQLAFQPQAVRWVHQIPSGFTGFVTIVFSAPHGEKTFRVDPQARIFEGDRVFQIPETGVLFADEPIDRWRRDEYVVLSSDGARKRIAEVSVSQADDLDELVKFDPAGAVVSMAGGGHFGPPGCAFAFVRYYVGTPAETQRQLERQHGPSWPPSERFPQIDCQK